MALEAGRSQVRFPVVPIFAVGKDDRCEGLENLPASYANSLEIWEPQPSGILRACTGIALLYM